MSDAPSVLRIALLGYGLIGREHAALVADHAATELAAIVDIGEEGRQAAARFGVPWFSEIAPMLDAVAPDGVIVALPNQLHVAAGLACIERRIPFLVEKPVADTAADAFALAAAAEAAGVATLVGHHRRHAPDIQAARAAIQRGELGRIVTVAGLCLVRKHDAYFEVAWRRRQGGGPLLINAIHDIDCFRFLCGEIDSVQAIASHAVRGFEVEDTVAMALCFRSGALGTFLLSDVVPSPWFWETASGQALYFPPQPETAYTIGGTHAALALPTGVLWHHHDGGDWRSPLLQSRLPIPDQRCYVAQLDHFVDLMRGGTASVVDARDGAMTVATLEAIERAATTQGPVAVADFVAAP
ncbi:MAG: gfo/Idh/MocA family oxidoreductase [Geminicoccaceae bacterium]|nr:MAG: gfo/Idh/MocA family oxidoreductase [Geminicoccaceae bacterium]